MLTERIGDAFGPPVDRVVRLVAHISPDVLTITGLALNGVACACFAFSGGKDYRMPELLRAGGLVALVATSSTCWTGGRPLRGRETKFRGHRPTRDRIDMVLYMGMISVRAGRKPRT